MKGLDMDDDLALELNKLAALADQSNREIPGLQMDPVDRLRLRIQYLVFDLQATRRERDFLRARLDSGTDPQGWNER
jgi:hypothetical protein